MKPLRIVDQIRILFALIPGIGGAFIMALVFDHVPMDKWWKWIYPMILIECVWLVYFLFLVGLFKLD